MKQLTFLTRDRVWFIGLILTLLSAILLYSAPALIRTGMGDAGIGIFFLNYLFVIFYFIVLLGYGRLKKGANGLAPLFLLLVLFLISAYSLNREMSIFEKATGWWVTVLVICCLNYTLLPFFSRLPLWVQHAMAMVAGLSVVVFGYLTLYLFPLYGVGVIGSFLLGVPLHSFVPLLFLIYTIVFIRRAGAIHKKLLRSFWAALGLVAVIIIVFLIRWFVVIREMNLHYNQANHAKGRDLPAWVYTAQHCRPGLVTEKILKTGLVYSTFHGDWDLFRMPHLNFGEERRHDPLVFLGTLLTGEPQLNEEERVKVLESLYSSRHEAEERLWKGDDLSTDSVHTAIGIWPGLHLSYTEKNITVTNKSLHAWDREEAIYSFHLPEGATVSSLSLWIDGKEEKGLLTTKGRADSAYRAIVGGENRDPSVVDWKEGNIVSVRVFPVTPGESRQFTIGITAPLEKIGNQLEYRNIYFDGPSSAEATEVIRIHGDHLLQDPVLPYFLIPGAGGKEENSKDIEYEGKYQTDWKIQFRDEGIGKEVFRFAGQEYSLAPYYAEREAVDLQQVYLDVNTSWEKEEYRQILQWAAPRKVYVYHPTEGLVEVGRQNEDRLFDELTQQTFSLFPPFVIHDPSRSLLISKCPPSSPSPGEIDASSGFSTKLRAYFSKGEKVRLFFLGKELSPYLKALKEFRAWRSESGDMADLKVVLDRSQFVRDVEEEDRVVIDGAGLVIRRSPMGEVAGMVVKGTAGAAAKGQVTKETAGIVGTGVMTKDSAGIAGAGPMIKPSPVVGGTVDLLKSEGPDHLLRLFSYHHILQAMGRRLAAGSKAGSTQDLPEQDNALVAEAQLAHIVTPLSSLIVLEKKEDYDRFKIADNINGLQNASLHAKGAVPEPAEWALIFLVLALLGLVKYRSWKLR